MTGQNYGQNRPGATDALTTSQAVNSDPQTPPNQAERQNEPASIYKRLYDLIDGFQTDSNPEVFVDLVLHSAFERLRQRAGLDYDSPYKPDGKVELTQLHLFDELYNSIQLAIFLSNLSEEFHRIEWTVNQLHRKP